MDIRKLQRAIVDGLEDVKALNIQVFNTEQLSPLFERVIVASGQSNRQTKALAASVRDAVKSRGMSVLRTEGEDNGEWIIVDCGAAVAHIMQPSIRDYYRLEEIWGGKPVKVKLGDAKGGLVKASEPIEDEDDEPAPPARKPAAKKAVAAKPARAAKPAPGKKAAPAKKAAGAKAPAKKAAGARAGTAAKAAPRAASGRSAGAAAKTTRAGAPSKSAHGAGVKKVVVSASSARGAAAKKTAAKPAAKPAAKKAGARRG
jgi:ribosome-associated protein